MKDMDPNQIKEQISALTAQMEELIEQLRPAPAGPQRSAILAKIAQRRDEIETLLAQLPLPERKGLEEKVNKIVKLERSGRK
ncbi:MAG TPA: hypothetical protein VHR86_01125 [Armatimonadota bacterium]|nr:hypothetical protein [Armatimonadota bacterium]